ncbi:MAG: hypothetical protein ABS35_22690 [Kaistia sp. SCN 65-12]|nr:MAG: hypothetical protein ABS35_22690 [Kaistia sp. SCN 65-12]
MTSLAAIHVAKKELDLDDDDYRNVLERVTGKRSAKDLSFHERALVMKEFGRLGFEVTYPDPYRPRTRDKAERAEHRTPAVKGAMRLDGVYARKLRALWISAWNLGVVRDRTDRALVAFVERQTGLSHTRFLREPADAMKAIEGLKKWIARECGIIWPGSTPNQNATKRAVITAQLKRLGLPLTNLDGVYDLDRYQAELGEQIRMQGGSK